MMINAGDKMTRAVNAPARSRKRLKKFRYIKKVRCGNKPLSGKVNADDVFSLLVIRGSLFVIRWP